MLSPICRKLQKTRVPLSRIILFLLPRDKPSGLKCPKDPQEYHRGPELEDFVSCLKLISLSIEHTVYKDSTAAHSQILIKSQALKKEYEFVYSEIPQELSGDLFQSPGAP